MQMIHIGNTWIEFEKSIKEDISLMELSDWGKYRMSEYLFNMIKGNISLKTLPDTIKSIKSNFNGYGGNGTMGTLHEILFEFMHPHLEKQKVFGTGNNGLKLYGSKRFVCDFYDKNKKTCYEIDGENHRTKNKQISDLTKEIFLIKKYNIETVRITNVMVEDLCKIKIYKLLGGEIYNENNK